MRIEELPKLPKLFRVIEVDLDATQWHWFRLGSDFRPGRHS
jgi:hypothetical protein